MQAANGYRFRFKVLLIIAGVFLAVVVARLAHLQLFNEEFYRGEAVKRRIRTTKTEPSRGVIYDSAGEILAHDQPCFNLCLPYKTMVDIEEGTGRVGIHEGPWVASVMELAHISHQEVMDRALEIVKRVERIRELEMTRYCRRRLAAPPRTYRIREELASHTLVEDVSFETVARVEAGSRKYGDLRVEACSRRHYPRGKVAAHIIGYTAPVTAEEVERYGDAYEGSPYKAYQESDYVGRMGVEEYYNKDLRGARGEIIEEITSSKADRRKILETPAIQGANLVLTLDMDVQVAVEKALGRQIGAFIVMNPYNGAILAMASYPRFDLNTLRQEFNKLATDSRSPLLHRAIQTRVPPGSLFKQVTTCAALRTHAITPQTRFFCPGDMVVGGIHFRCWNEYGHGSLDLEEAIMKSCNCYFYQTGKATGGEALVRWAGLYGLGRRTGVDLPGECEGLITPPRKKALGDVYNLSIGQGKTTATPLQMVRMVSVAANGGWLVRPHVLLKITDHNGVVLTPPLRDEAYREEKPLPVPAADLRLLREAFRGVVTEGTVSYTAEKDFLLEAGVAGKSGTAQTADKEVNHGWFAGYVPYDHPRLAFVILAEKVPGHGGETCAPILQAFLEEYSRLADQRRLAKATY